ncbi:hypothetical protein [Thauera sinica]|uniref:Uncharacterized protein n=1 Tax=Thauera sinica TaxID=2665146 RepID=A0ABW1AS49_9RHOO|nr:hypothetical protein [Thauera sp. K11]
MQSLDANFWIGLALAIPLSVLGNLATPWFQQLLSRQSERRAKAHVEEMLSELSEIEELAKNPSILMLDLLREVLFIILITTASAVIFGTMAWLNSFFPTNKWLSVSPLMLISVGIMIAKYSFDATIKARNVRHLNKHREVIKRRLKELGHDVA